MTTPQVIHHPLKISKKALEIIKTLQAAGYEAYAVGGCVRDQLVGKMPKDFDVATNAHPEEIKPLFKRCLLIGKRFRLAHVYFGREFIEVATFRGNGDDSTHQQAAATGLIVRDNHFGSIEEDAVRRDFTANALYYNPSDQTIIDYCGGLEDIKQGQLKLIGEPDVRFREDPVRMLRAIRFANKLNLKLSSELLAAIQTMHPLLGHIPAGRMFDEYGKLFLHAQAKKNFDTLRKFNLLQYFFPALDTFLKQDTLSNHSTLKMIEEALHNTDDRIIEEKGVNPIFLISVMLWHDFQQKKPYFLAQGHEGHIAETAAINYALDQQIRYTAFPKRLGATIRAIWALQRPLEQRRPRQIHKILANPKFRAAFDFLLLRCHAAEVPEALCHWWEDIQLKTGSERGEMIQALVHKRSKKRKKNRKTSSSSNQSTLRDDADS